MTPQSPKEALPGKFPPRLRVKIGNENYYDHYGASEIVFEQHVDIWGHRFDDWPKYLSLSEHESALAEAVRKAREETACHLSQRLVSLCYGEADDDGNAELLPAKEIEQKLIAEMDRCIDAHMSAAALSVPGEEKNG